MIFLGRNYSTISFHLNKIYWLQIAYLINVGDFMSDQERNITMRGGIKIIKMNSTLGKGCHKKCWNRVIWYQNIFITF